VGAFNQVYAVYAIASQFATFGIQHSALKHTAEYAENPQLTKIVTWSAAFLAFLSGLLVGG